MRIVTALVSSALALALLPRTALASDAVAVAAAQFDRGVEAMSTGDFDVACPALAESVRIDPRPGALFTLAECEARWGRLASADVHYAEYLSWFARMSAEEQRQQVGRDRISEDARAELKAIIPRITVRVSAPLPPSAVVKRDGLVLGIPSLDVPLPVDPGVHVVLLELPDGRSTQKIVTVERGASEDVWLDLPAVDLRLPPERPKARAIDRAGPYAAFGVGIVGLGVGTAFGVVAMSKTGVISEHCDGAVCDREGVIAADSARTSATVSTVGFAVGIVGLGAGALLLFLRARGATSASSWDPARGSTAAIRGVF